MDVKLHKFEFYLFIAECLRASRSKGNQLRLRRK